MFTGLIEHVGEILELRRCEHTAQLQIAATFANELIPGESVAVNGVCLTVTGVHSHHFTVDMVNTTLAVTNLGDATKHSLVNLERALRLGDRLGGHICTGHVDAVATIKHIEQANDNCHFHMSYDTAWDPYIVPKGSICLDGVSLTVVDCSLGSCYVALIPHTLTHTHLHSKKPGDRLNMETDYLGKYVVRRLIT